VREKMKKSRKIGLILLAGCILLIGSMLILKIKLSRQVQLSRDLEVEQITLLEAGEISEEALSPDGKNTAFIFSNKRPGVGGIFGEDKVVKAFYPSDLNWRYYANLSWESNRVISFVLKSSPYHEVLFKLDVISEKILLKQPRQPND